MTSLNNVLPSFLLQRKHSVSQKQHLVFTHNPSKSSKLTPPPPESRWPKSAPLGRAGSWSPHRGWKLQQTCASGAATHYAQFSSACGNQDWLFLVMLFELSQSNHQPGTVPPPHRLGGREVLRSWKMYGHPTSA